MKYKPLHFIGAEIKVHFNREPLFSKKPTCPDNFHWQGKSFLVVENGAEWQDFSRKGRMAHTMRPANAAKAIRRGSWGVGRFYFRVLTEQDRIFELYYDRAPKDVDDRDGSWFLDREMQKTNDEKDL